MSRALARGLVVGESFNIYININAAAGVRFSPIPPLLECFNTILFLIHHSFIFVLFLQIGSSKKTLQVVIHKRYAVKMPACV